MEATNEDASLDELNFLQLKKKCLSKGIQKAKVAECLDRASLVVLLQSSDSTPPEGIATASNSTSSGNMSKDDLLKRLKQLEQENLALREGDPAPDLAGPINEGERPRGSSIFSYFQVFTHSSYRNSEFCMAGADTAGLSGCTAEHDAAPTN